MKHLSPHFPALKEFANAFDPLEHAIETEYHFGLPDLFLKDGSRMSKRSMDVDNCVKPINDMVFLTLQQYNADIDDGLVHQCLARKSESALESTLIVLRMVSLGLTRKTA